MSESYEMYEVVLVLMFGCILGYIVGSYIGYSLGKSFRPPSPPVRLVVMPRPSPRYDQEYVKVGMVRDKKLLKQWNHKEPCLDVITKDSCHMIPGSRSLWLKNIFEDAEEREALFEDGP